MISLKKLIQPFVLKCHPDMAQQQGLPKTAQKVNLKAIQNLNAYVDGVQSMEKEGTKYPFASPNDIIEIEFVMAFSSSAGGTNSSSNKASQPTTSRRRVELQVPPPTLPLPKVSRHVQRQVVKLLRMADLPVPSLYNNNNMEEDEADQDYYDEINPKDNDITEGWMAGQVIRQSRRRKTAWERSRQQFVSSINWKTFDKVYDEAMADAQAHVMTQNVIRDNPKLRHALLAKILSHIQFTRDVLPLERLVAYRRLLRLLEDHFDYLQLEAFGKYWEELRLVVTQARPYNTSSSAMRKRRQKNLETGYRFTIHHDNSVTVSIPVDFQNDELIQELYRNVGDFCEWTQQETGMESIFVDGF
jgi:hypothetical protein